MKTYVFTNRVYPPVGGATGVLLKELAEGLVAAGARVVVVTSREGEADGRRQTAGDQEAGGPPTHGVTTAGQAYGRRQTADGRSRETINGVEVIRVGTATFTRASHWRRALSYLGLYPQLMWQVRRLGKVDAVVSMTDPPLQVAAVTVASCRAAKRIHWAQDVYPELAEELGVIKRGGILARVLRAVSTWALRKQDEIVVVGRCMRERLVQRGVDAGKIEVIPNWSPVAAVPAGEVATMRRKLGWGDEVVALYSGNLGLAHDFETIIEAAKLLVESRVRVVFAGEGPRWEEVKRATAGMANVSFLPPQPKEDLAAFLAAADVHLVTVRAGLEGLVVPSKIYGILAARRPVIYVGAADSEAGKLLLESRSGVVIANGDGAGLAAALTALSANEGQGAETAERPAAEVADFTLEKAVERWQTVLNE